MSAQPETSDNEQTETQPDTQETGNYNALVWLLLLAIGFGLAWQYVSYDETKKTETENRLKYEREQREKLEPMYIKNPDFPHYWEKEKIFKTSKTKPTFKGNNQTKYNTYREDSFTYDGTPIEINPSEEWEKGIPFVYGWYEPNPNYDYQRASNQNKEYITNPKYDEKKAVTTWPEHPTEDDKYIHKTSLREPPKTEKIIEDDTGNCPIAVYCWNERNPIYTGQTKDKIIKSFYLVGGGLLLFFLLRPKTENQNSGLNLEELEPYFNEAHFMTYREAQRAGLTDNENGLLIGYHPLNGMPLRYSGDKHLTTFAGTRGGKGTCCQIPALLDYQGSILAIDPKAENCAITASYRRDVLGQKVFILSPYKTDADNVLRAQGFTVARFNPLLDLDTSSPEFSDNVINLCHSLVYNDSKDSFWDNSARNLLACLVMYVCLADGETRTLIRARELLCLTWKKDNDFETMDESGDIVSLRVALWLCQKTGYKPLVELVQQFIEKEPKMMDSFHQTAIEQTAFLSSLPLAKSLSESDFRLADLKDKKITVFLVLPPKHLLKAGRWFRLILTAAVNELTTKRKADKDVLLLVDEAKILGNLPALQTVLSFSAGFGVKLWSFWQSMASLNENYGDNGAAEFFDNSGVLQFFTPSNLETAEFISDRCGEKTIFTNSTSTNTSYRADMFGDNMNGAQNFGTTQSQSERFAPLISAYDLMGLPKTEQIAFISGQNAALKALRLGYFENEDYEHKAKPNPYRDEPTYN